MGIMWWKPVTVYFKEFARRDDITILATKICPFKPEILKKMIHRGHGIKQVC
jgi:hypothetical protein